MSSHNVGSLSCFFFNSPEPLHSQTALTCKPIKRSRYHRRVKNKIKPNHFQTKLTLLPFYFAPVLQISAPEREPNSDVFLMSSALKQKHVVVSPVKREGGADVRHAWLAPNPPPPPPYRRLRRVGLDVSADGSLMISEVRGGNLSAPSHAITEAR